MNNNLGNKETMAKNLRYYMDIKGINQTELASALNIPVTTISNWLHANTYPRIDKIELMASFFGVSKSDLVEDCNDTIIEIHSAEREREQSYRRIVAYFNLLNQSGKQKALEQIDLLTKIPEYCEQTDYLINAAHSRTDIDIPENADTSDDDVMDDDNF